MAQITLRGKVIACEPIQIQMAAQAAGLITGFPGKPENDGAAAGIQSGSASKLTPPSFLFVFANSMTSLNGIID